jgi:outer membrane receptor protein involved in Fe transport
MAALGAAPEAARAQDQELEEVVVTGSRIRTTGIDMPNPVMVVTREEMSVIAPTNMIEGLAELPQFYASSTTQNPSPFFTSDGAGSLNLRGLQSKRSLQLLDGRRVVPSTIFGGPDINLFPENMIRTVETVTGGATAAYGTDAVAGAVNFILDTDFEGIRANVSAGENDGEGGQHYEASFGGGFALGERTHLLVSLERSEQDPIWGYDILEYDWYKARALLESTAPGAGQSRENPALIAVDQVYSMNYSLDGILHFPAAQGGSQIFDASGNYSPFVLGSPCSTHGCSTVNGGSGVDSGLPSMAISPDSGRENAFVYVEHQFGENLNVFGQFISAEAEFTQRNFGGLFGNPPGAGSDRSFVIYPGNPFTPPALQASVAAAAAANPTLGGVQFSRIGAEQDLAFDARTQQKTETDSATVGFEYDFSGDGFFDGWQLGAYYQKGETDVNAIQRGGIRLDRIYLAADAVTDPLTGQPACNVTVTTRNTANPIYQDCVPINLFGRGRASAQAIDWVTGFEPGVQMNAQGFLSATETLPHSYVSSENKQRVIDIHQDVWEISMDGQLAEGWAGPITMAFGAGYREEWFNQVVEVGPGGNVNADPRFRPVRANNAALGIRGVPGGALASGNSVEIQFSNVPFARGKQDVTEAFTEFLIPLVSGRKGVQQLNLSAAARLADYSGAGRHDSWKGGFDWAIVDSLRLRTTVSQDVRAATMGEKFDRTGGIGNVRDYLLSPPTGVAYGVTTFSNGSPDILPEQGKTKTFGIVFQPTKLSGLNLSVDWYSVDITDNINQITATQVVEDCQLRNDQYLCSLITRGDTLATPIEDPSQTIRYISLVGVPYYNQAAVEAEGIDYEVNYRKNVDWTGGGEAIGMRFIASYLNERNNIDRQGQVTKLVGNFNFPEWSYLLSGTYNRGNLGFTLSARYTDEMLVNSLWNFNGPSTRWDVADNEVAAETVLDARFNYRFDMGGGSLNVFANINNLTDTGPEEFLNAAYSSNFSAGTGLGVTGESRGRRYSVGVSMDFGGR